MAEQQRIVKWTVGATDSRRPLTSKLYNTTYAASYGRFVFPRNSGTQSSFNYRPALYRPSFSHMGKPQPRHLLLDGFTSQTKGDYRPHEGGLPQMRTFPKIDMSFAPHRPVSAASQSHLTAGQRGECGFTEGADLPLMTFQENKRNMVGFRPTGKSVMKTDFLPPSQLRRVEKFQDISNRVFQESGFISMKKTAPTEVSIGKKEPSGFLHNTTNQQVFPNLPFSYLDFITNYQHDFCHRADVRAPRFEVDGVGVITTQNESGYSRHNMDRVIIKG